MPHAAPLALLLGFVGAVSLPAQMIGGAWEDRRTLVEPLPHGSWFGADLVGDVDVDLDGIPDQVVGAPLDHPGGLVEAGSVFVYSGADGSLLHHFTGPRANHALGWSVAAADLDLDGAADILAGGIDGIGSAFPGAVYAWSGATGQLLYEISVPWATNYGEALAIVTDRDGDQVADFLMGSSDTTINGDPFAGMVELRSGADGSLLHRWSGTDSFLSFGGSVTELEDINGDGVGELAFGMPGYDLVFREGAVQVVDGATYQVLKTFTITAHGPDQQLGMAIANPGDVNADGIGDLLVGATSDAGYTGRAYVIDGASHFTFILHDFPGRASSDFFGESLCAAGDVDQDGHADVLIGAGQAGSSLVPGYVELYSGRDGSLMMDWQGAGDVDHMGRVALAGDLDGDGDQEIQMGAWLQSGGPGYVRIVGLQGFLDLDARSLSLGAGIPLEMDLDFPTSESGLAFALQMSLAGVGSTVVGGMELPLVSDQLFQRMLGGWSPPALSPARGVLDAQGDATATLLPNPGLSMLLGRDLFLCAVSFDPITQVASRTSVSRSVKILP